MSSTNSVPADADASSSTRGMEILSRRGSRASLSGMSQVDKEQLSQALDKIHTSASQSDTLTTFNEFASPPSTSAGLEAKGLTDELIQNGISGLYNRFKGAVVGGKEKPILGAVKDDGDSPETSSMKSQPASTTPSNKSSNHGTSKGNLGSLASPLMLSSPASRLQSPTTPSFATQSLLGQDSSQQSVKNASGSVSSGSRPVSNNRSQITPLTKSTPAAIIVPTVAPVTVSAFRQNDTAQSGSSNAQSDNPPGDNATAKKSPFSSLAESPSDRRYSNKSDASENPLTPTLPNFQERLNADARVSSSTKNIEQDGTTLQPAHSNTKLISKDTKDRPDLRVDLPRASDSLQNVDGAEDLKAKAPVSLNTVYASSSSSQVANIQKAAPLLKRSAAIERLTQSHLPGYRPSRASSTDRSTAEFSPITTSAHNSVRHESFSHDDDPNAIFPGYRRIPGTTTSGDPQAVSNRLEQMRKQVLSKEYWMKDETCKECFLCGNGFSAFRRKHHCRTCGCIFDSKCTSIIPGDRFGVQGSLRVCKTCLDIINRRHESSGSDDSGDDASMPAPFLAHFHEDPTRNQSIEGARPSEWDVTHQFATPMMAIPATRRTGDSSSRRSAVLEIDAPALPRPNSSRSLKSLSGRPSSSGHRRLHSKHNFLGRLKSSTEQRAPFRRDAVAEMGRRSKLPAFHDDNIIDPDLAPYMSDDASSGDEQIGIYAAMSGVSGSVQNSSLDHDRPAIGSVLPSGKRHRIRPDKSVSGISFTSRGIEDGSISGSAVGHSRTGRRRNLSTASNIVHQNRSSPRSNKMGNLIKGIGSLGEELLASRESIPSIPAPGSSQMTRSASMRDEKFPPVELHPTMLHHVENLLRQLLQDEGIPHSRSWEKALLPILLRCIDDVNMNIRRGDEIDIRHYVKLKKVPGGRPGDTAYVSGVVFTKKLALKSMPRSIRNPRIVVLSFPIEYSRHRDSFMSLEPIIAQEQEFLRNMVNRIASLRPSVLLVQKHVSGLALQYLNEANITVVSNVKHSVIAAVSRCTETITISSIDMVTLRPVVVGKSSGFEVKTYVNNDIPNKKKTLVYISGCPKELGCTIVLRGASMPILARMKRITEFMVGVVYNNVLETSMMRDQFISIPPTPDDSGSLSPSHPETSQTALSPDPVQVPTQEDPAMPKTDNPNDPQDAAEPLQSSELEDETAHQSLEGGPKLVSAHESHVDNPVPDDVPMPTFYSDLMAKHETKILSASPHVKYNAPYLLARVREQERLIMHFKRLRDLDTFEEQTEEEKAKPQQFQLIKPEMIHETVKGAPKQIMEVLHAVHDAEYDKALHNYQTHQRQWENSIQGIGDLFNPYWHQNIVVLYTLVCTATTVPCSGPDILALEFYNEHLQEASFDPDCTLGQYVEDLCLSADALCSFGACGRKMTEHHRTYVHGEARITVFLERIPSKLKGLENSILMWSYCKKCKKETQVMPMSESTWKYSFGKYLEMSFWSSSLNLRAGFCPHDFYKNHVRYFGFRDIAVRIHYDPIDLLEVVVPRARITYKVDNDLRLKNEIFTKTEERWNRFMASVKTRIKGINLESVIPEKSGACKTEVDNMLKQANEEQESMIRKLQEKYMESKYWEIIPMNRALRAMQEKVAHWDARFETFGQNFFPSERDIRRLATLQLRKVFMDRDESTTSLVSTELGDIHSDIDEKSTTASIELNPNPSELSAEEVERALSSVLDGTVVSDDKKKDDSLMATPDQSGIPTVVNFQSDAIESLDLASQATPLLCAGQADQPSVLVETPQELSPSGSYKSATLARAASMAGSSEASDTTIKPAQDSDTTISPTCIPAEAASIASSAEASTSTEISHASDTTIKLTRSSTTDDVSLTDELLPTPPAQATGATGIPRPTDRKTSRRIGTVVSPPVSRTQSQPVGHLRRVHASVGPNSNLNSAMLNDPFTSSQDNRGTSAQDTQKGIDRKHTDRFGLSLKTHRKVGQSLIPRRRQDSKVHALARHFDQISREFEKERMRDRKQRAYTLTQSRAYPISSSKPIVEVYKNVNDAVAEHGQFDLDVPVAPAQADEVATTPLGGDLNSNQKSSEDVTPASPSGTIINTQTATETDGQEPETSQAQSDEDGTASDAENSLLEDLAGASDTAVAHDINEVINDIEVNAELPKPEKSSIVKLLSTFWAERSASGWQLLEYPSSASDHIFVDSDIIVREDEPSSLIAFALDSADYKEKLQNIRQQGRGREEGLMENGRSSSLDPCQDGINQAEVETSLLRATGTHLKYQFIEGSAKMSCKIFYAEQFDAIRRKCGVGDRIVESLSRCLKWDSKGGKTKSVFLKTLDERLVLKSLSPIETQAFLRFAPAYFNIMAEALFHDLPSVMAKMLGFYQIIIKNPATNTEIKWDVLVMENLFYDRILNRIFDLKGSMRNRKIQSTGEQNEVLLDENMVEFIYESPLFAREHSKKLLRASVWNDTLFLARQNVMDYSLMVAVDESKKELVVGIIDCIRTYTWDKKLESWIKDKGFVGGNRARPTVTSPKEYKSRFREAMDRYVLQAPSCWHQFRNESFAVSNNGRKPRMREDTNDEVVDADRYDNA